MTINTPRLPLDDDDVSAADLVGGASATWQNAQDKPMPRRRHPLFVDDEPDKPITRPDATPPAEDHETTPAPEPAVAASGLGATRWTPADAADPDVSAADDSAGITEDVVETQGQVLIDAEGLLERMLPKATIRPRQWWRRLLRLGPDAATVRRAQVEAGMRTPLERPLTIAVMQPRGEAGKTVTVIGVAAALATARGGGVIAWDANESGILADRLERQHLAHIGDLLSSTEWFLQPESTMIELERVLQHQSDAFFKALASNQASDDDELELSLAQFNALHRVLMKYFPITLIDTGNSEKAQVWRAAMSVADVIMVPLKLRPDHIVPAARALRNMQRRGDQLQGRVVLVISCGPGDRQLSGPDMRQLLQDHGLLQYQLIEVPTDPAIDTTVVRWDAMADETQDAYRAIGATLLAMATQAQHNTN
ncbi:MAG TPA: hypothetical protein PLA44_14070 [Propionibacteriaceae bacterium]|nr:hypothetical protein [Propionibacteriaceae bacterium]